MQARHAFAKGKAPKRPAFKHRLIVKFRDDRKVRATASGEVLEHAHGAKGTHVAELDLLVRKHQLRFSQLIRLSEDRLALLESRGARGSGTAEPDLAGILVVSAPEGEIQAAADALHASALTELVYFEEIAPPPPQACTDVAPQTPSYFSMQTYHGPNPGINMSNAWNLGSTRGAGVRIADCEYGYVATHEDLCGIIPEAGQTPAPDVAVRGWDQHGTAVFGELVSGENGYGCTGLVPQAEAYFFPEWTQEEGFRRATAIANAIATVDPGDVVLLEMQRFGIGGGYGPAELDPTVWMITKAGTDGGVIVVGAAGNGNQNLDGPDYSEYRNRGDSGAIIVGAGSANTSHSRLGFSTYGARVNVQGWGQSVFSLGYGSFAELGGDPNQRYRATFSGTSSASPFVAATAVSLQSFAQSFLGERLTPLEMRDLLISTGIPQGAGEHIGPFPNVVAGVNAIRERGSP